MARQETTCWSCGTRWISGNEPRVALRVIRGGLSTHVVVEPDTLVAALALDPDD